MTETIRYGPIGKQDIRRGFGTFQVTLADGRIVTLDELGVELSSYALASLPPAGTAGRLADVTDSIGGIHKVTGPQWIPIGYGLINVKDRPFGACYFDRGDGKRQWSLRSRDGAVDVAKVAKRHGGGGHRNAAGFEESIPC